MGQPNYALVLLSYVLTLAACGGVKLIEVQKSAAALNLSPGQREIVEPKIEFISDIVEDYNFEKHELELSYQRYRSEASLPRLSRYEGGGRRTMRQVYREQNALRTMIRAFARQRQEYIKEITNLIQEIRATLTPRQLVTFEEIELPKLKLPNVLRRSRYNDFLFIPGSRMGSHRNF
ncbi:MAG: hypothetical protein OXN17_20730 [Candidatus Poribacteria bacterium]|nr:hypothetical protein [Candidatus Poribacteria bacterium]